MTGYENEGDRTEQMRAGFQQQGEPGLAADAERQVRQKRLLYTALGALLTVLGVVATIFRLTRGDDVGPWTGFYAAGTILAALGVLLARRASLRLAFVVIVVGGAVAGLGDSVSR
ncbi:hypothetical protein [Streptomyces sp. KR80]|uniref:hypothetical protein n=1 Tax=Streptomyces sp. KR80 TaxID=3457426 RepID=UPI003FD083B8